MILDHERLWAPWRLGYVKGDRQPQDQTPPLKLLPGADAACFMCRAVADSRDRENLVVARGRDTFVILNRFPYNNGHLLVACQRHLGRLDELPTETNLELIETITSLTTLMTRLMNAEGFNIGLNLGKVAGAGVPGHLHWHIVPRWPGDTNFMPVVAGVEVIPQALDALWAMLSEAMSENSDRPHA
jgi:ATP adenylyltransferase